jgi:general stress protein CsbA
LEELDLHFIYDFTPLYFHPFVSLNLKDLQVLVLSKVHKSIQNHHKQILLRFFLIFASNNKNWTNSVLIIVIIIIVICSRNILFLVNSYIWWHHRVFYFNNLFELFHKTEMIKNNNNKTLFHLFYSTLYSVHVQVSVLVLVQVQVVLMYWISGVLHLCTVPDCQIPSTG